MKKILVLVLSGLILAGTLSAQAATGSATPTTVNQTTATITKVEGKLALVNGMIAIQTKDKTYYVGSLQRLIGFIDGLKEGATVKVEGYAQVLPAAPEYAHLQLTKLTFNGKDYDLSQAAGFGGRGGMMGGRGMGGQGFDGKAGPTTQGNGPMMGRGQGNGRRG